MEQIWKADWQKHDVLLTFPFMLKIELMDRSPKLDIFVKMTLRSGWLGDVDDDDELVQWQESQSHWLLIVFFIFQCYYILY